MEDLDNIFLSEKKKRRGAKLYNKSIYKPSRKDLRRRFPSQKRKKLGKFSRPRYYKPGLTRPRNRGGRYMVSSDFGKNAIIF